MEIDLPQEGTNLLKNYAYHKALSTLKDRSALSSISPSSRQPTRQNLMEVCLQFEAIFAKQMLDSMRKNVLKTGLIDGGMAEEIFEDMLWDEYALVLARNGNLGLSKTIYSQLAPLEANLISAQE